MVVSLFQEMEEGLKLLYTLAKGIGRTLLSYIR